MPLIARLSAVQSGKITVDNLIIGQCRDDELAKTLSILPQTNEIALRLMLKDLVAFGRYPHHKGRPTAKDHELTSQAIEVFDLGDLAHRPLTTLSGGQRQRALVAMTFAQNTDYILLDEPLNNLDIAASRRLMATLRDLSRNHGRTIVIVLHDINYAAGHADHIVTLRDGRLGPSGAPNDIINGSLMQEIFGTDAKVHDINGRPMVEV